MRIPDALQICRLRSRAGTCDHQVTAVMKQQFNQFGIFRSEFGDPPVGRHIFRSGGRAQVQFHPFEQRGIIGYMGMAKFVKSPARRFADTARCEEGGIPAVPPGRFVKPVETGGSAEKERHCGRPADMHAVVISPASSLN
mgnify:CR=1 FL=1